MTLAFGARGRGRFVVRGGRFGRGLLQHLLEQDELVRVELLRGRAEQAPQQIIDALLVLREVDDERFNERVVLSGHPRDQRMARFDVIGKFAGKGRKIHRNFLRVERRRRHA